ncbi:MAG: carboxypeptidase regulatory-like domain-containing protein [Candidatus Sericytochromatia bacterium]|nr:carboxypeptidase regulatory-like domain-containing protein [Candidatus Sericytochromatia bacterium]
MNTRAQVTLGLVLTGCAATAYPSPTPTPPVTRTVVSTPSPGNSQGAPPGGQDRCEADGGCISPSNLIGGSLRIQVRDTADAPLAGATVVAAGSGLGFGRTDGAGARAFDDMNAGTYTVTVSATGHLTQQATVSLSAVPLPGIGSSQVTIPVVQLSFRLAPTTRILEGSLRDTSGQPVSGARIVLGLQDTESGPDGSFRLEAGPGTGAATIHHVGFEEETTTGGAKVLTARPVALTLTGWPFGEPDAATLTRLQAALGQAPLSLTGPVAPTARLGTILWCAAPSALSPSEEEAMGQHLDLGGTVLVSADWGAARGLAALRLQEVLRRLGAYTRIDIVRASNGLPDLLPDWNTPVDDLNLMMRGACTVEAAPPSAILGTVPLAAYRVASGTAPSYHLAVSRRTGRGRLVVVGDTQMLWPVDDTAANAAAQWLRRIIAQLG